MRRKKCMQQCVKKGKSIKLNLEADTENRRIHICTMALCVCAFTHLYRSYSTFAVDPTSYYRAHLTQWKRNCVQDTKKYTCMVREKKTKNVKEYDKSICSICQALIFIIISTRDSLNPKNLLFLLLA